MCQALNRPLFSLLLAASFLSPLPVWAGPVVDHAAQAEAAMASDPVAALGHLDAAIEEVWKASPLMFRKVLFVESAGGYGIYAERPNAIFKPDEPIMIYGEPVGFGYGKTALGGLEINLVMDFVLANEAGEELFTKGDFISYQLPVRYHNREFNTATTLNLTGLQPGKYIAKFKMRDKHSDKSGAFELPFEVAP